MSHILHARNNQTMPKNADWIDWKDSVAKQILLNDLKLGVLSLDENVVSATQAWELYRDRPPFANVVFSQFKARLKDHRAQVVKIAWKESAARQVLLDDLESGFLSLKENEVSATQAWEHYRNLPEFSNVAFSQFKEQLKSHRDQVGKKRSLSVKQSMALDHDRLIHPCQDFNDRSERVFDRSKAKQLLREDVKNKKHEAMIPSKLQRSRPEEYMQFKPDIFKGRIYQEVRRQKFINYLEAKRAKGKAQGKSKNS